jgi:hypothetical protein
MPVPDIGIAIIEWPAVPALIKLSGEEKAAHLLHSLFEALAALVH